jgi:hypothetical protein
MTGVNRATPYPYLFSDLRNTSTQQRAWKCHGIQDLIRSQGDAVRRHFNLSGPSPAAQVFTLHTMFAFRLLITCVGAYSPRCRGVKLQKESRGQLSPTQCH